jgi:putative NADH-flavin reductase
LQHTAQLYYNKYSAYHKKFIHLGSDMSPTKLLTVFGATGNQGGSVVKSVLAHPTLSKEYKIRAITRDPSKPNAQALAAKGVEPVKADMEDAESVKQALEGSYAVFAVTNYWEKASKDLEIQQGKAIADAAKAVGVKHLVWSALPNATKLTNGVLSHIEHFDSKAEVAEYIESIKGDMVATYFMPGFYMSNIKGSIKPGQDGVPTWTQPFHPTETQVPLFDTATDTGTFVAGILSQHPRSVNGLYVPAVSQWLTPNEIVQTVTKVSGTEVKFQSLPEKVWQSFLPMAENIAQELAENMVLIRDYSYYGKGAEKEQAKADEKVLAGAKTVSWEEFVEAHGPWKW